MEYLLKTWLIGGKKNDTLLRCDRLIITACTADQLERQRWLMGEAVQNLTCWQRNKPLRVFCALFLAITQSHAAANYRKAVHGVRQRLLGCLLHQKLNPKPLSADVPAQALLVIMQ